MVPRHLVPHNWSPIYWSLWTNGPQPIQSQWTNGPQKFGPHGQMVPNQFVPPGQMVPRVFQLSRGAGCGNLEIWGPNWLGPFVQGDQHFREHLSRGTGFDGDHLSWGINFMGIFCPGGQKEGDQKSGDHMVLLPNLSQPNSVTLSQILVLEKKNEIYVSWTLLHTVQE